MIEMVRRAVVTELERERAVSNAPGAISDSD